MIYDSEDKTLSAKVNDLYTRAMKVGDDARVDYNDLLIVLNAVAELQRRLNDLESKN